MDFGIKRLVTEPYAARLYHLYDKWERLRLVADHGSPWLMENPQHGVRIGRPDGQMVALLNLPWQEEDEGMGANGRLPNTLSHTSYALITNHAVCAIFDIYQSGREDKLAPALILEAEENRWLAQPNRELDGYRLFAAAPSHFRMMLPMREIEAGEQVGQLAYNQFGYDFAISLANKRFGDQASLIALGLTVLIDHFS